jgi:hypothetical protein
VSRTDPVTIAAGDEGYVRFAAGLKDNKFDIECGVRLL